MIQFENRKICNIYYEQIFYSLHTYHNEDFDIFMKDLDEYTNLCILFSPTEEEQKLEKKMIAAVLANVTIRIFLTDWFKDLLQEQFHYKDAYEIETITAIAKDIFLNNDRHRVPIHLSFHTWQKEMVHVFETFLTNSYRFSFDSFLRFRLREHRKRLQEVVENAIEEYKYEHDYQLLLQTCRDYLKNHSPKEETVHVYIDENVLFMDGDGNEIPHSVIRKWLTNDLTFEYPLPLEERIIGPLVAIAPKKAIVHLKRYDEGLIHTLMTVFEERLKLIEEHDFYQK